MAESIRQFGFKIPVLVDKDGVLVAGHTRIQAARQLGLTEVPVICANDLTPEQIRAYRIADNKTADLATWDLELLPIELSELQGMDFDLELLGFSKDDLAKLFDPGVKDGLTDPDEVPEPPDEAITQPGDLWILGDHRLLCGDSSKPEDVDRLLGRRHDPTGEHRSAVQREGRAAEQQRHRRRQQFLHQLPPPSSWTWPGTRRSRNRPTSRCGRRTGRWPTTSCRTRRSTAMLLAWFGNMARVLEPGRAFYIWGGYANCGNYPPALKASKLYFSQAIIWDKEHPVLTRKDFMGAHEWCFYGWKEGAGHKFFGPNNATDLWHVKKINPNKMVHLTEKPVELAVRAMQYSSRAGENVLDLFGGSGSTLIAAEQTGRKAFLMEIGRALLRRHRPSASNNSPARRPSGNALARRRCR